MFAAIAGSAAGGAAGSVPAVIGQLGAQALADSNAWNRQVLSFQQSNEWATRKEEALQQGGLNPALAWLGTGGAHGAAAGGLLTPHLTTVAHGTYHAPPLLLGSDNYMMHGKSVRRDSVASTNSTVSSRLSNASHLSINSNFWNPRLSFNMAEQNGHDFTRRSSVASTVSYNALRFK
uniref:VP2 n=1 Tax=Beihai fish calicivirus TaxID=2116162 RepID=A0A2P1GMI9_9CALI|nr:VP2 [Beihai fish calicivirus]